MQWSTRVEHAEITWQLLGRVKFREDQEWGQVSLESV